MSIADVSKCGARTRGGGRCRQPVIAGRSRCRLHGGRTPRGLASPHIRHGRYSADMPTRMLARFDAAMADPELLSLRSDIAFLTARIGEKMAELEEAGQSVDWQAVWDKVENAIQNGKGWDWTRNEREWKAIGELLTDRRDEQTIMREIRSLTDQRARLVAQENRRLAELKQTMTLEQATVLAQSLAAIIKRHIKDQPTLTAINREFQEIVDLPGSCVVPISSKRRD